MKNNKLVLKSQQTFRSENYNAVTEEVNKIALSATNEKNNTINHFNRNMWIQQEEI